MDNVYVVLTRTDTMFDDRFKDVSAIFKSYKDALAYLQKKYEEYSEKAKRYNKEYKCDDWQCYFDDGVVRSYGDKDDVTIKIVSVKFGDEIDVWNLI